MRIRFLSSALALLGLVASATAAQAQAGSVAGRVTQSGTANPVAGAQVAVVAGTARIAVGQSGDDGNQCVAKRNGQARARQIDVVCNVGAIGHHQRSGHAD